MREKGWWHVFGVIVFWCLVDSFAHILYRLKERLLLITVAVREHGMAGVCVRPCPPFPFLPGVNLDEAGPTQVVA